jgi:hypothetical protein
MDALDRWQTEPTCLRARQGGGGNIIRRKIRCPRFLKYGDRVRQIQLDQTAAPRTMAINLATQNCSQQIIPVLS